MLVVGRNSQLEAQLASIRKIELRYPNGRIKPEMRKMYIDLVGRGIPLQRVNTAVCGI